MDDFNIDKAVAVEEKDGKPIISADAPFNVDNAVPNPPRSKGILDPQKGEVTIGEAPPVSPAIRGCCDRRLRCHTARRRPTNIFVPLLECQDDQKCV